MKPRLAPERTLTPTRSPRTRGQTRLANFLIAAFFVWVGPIPETATFAAANPEIRTLIAALERDDTLEVQGSRIALAGLIADFYERRSFAPALDDKKMRELFAAIEGMQAHGLDANDYHRSAVEELRERPPPLSPRTRAELEVLLLDAFLRMAYHRAYGKVDPATLDPNWNFGQRLITSDPLRELTLALDAPSPVEYLDHLLDEPDFYRDLTAALARYRAIAAEGGWQPIDSGPVLKLAMMDPRLPAVRSRLKLTADLAEDRPPPDPEVFDHGLRQAVERFQRRHGLIADGVIGPATLGAMNLPVTRRIDQIRVNLERARWVQRGLPEDFVLVNIASFRAFLVRSGDEIWSSRVQVGKPYRETPVFRDAIEYLVFNPTWTVPPGILRKDIIPQAQEDPEIIRAKGLRVLDRDGLEVEPDTVDWSADPFPYILRQDPGPNNALGLVKLMFPNEHLVYLHDTPSKELFERAQRTESSGCIRVERPLELAELLLSENPGWNPDRIDRVIASKLTTHVGLVRPMPVLILYWTAEVLDDGRVSFRDDIYGRDAPILKALAGDFSLSPSTQLARARPKPEPPAAAAWVVQVASLRDEASARGLVAKLSGKGFDAFIQRSLIEGKDYHRVRIGPLGSRLEGDAMVHALQLRTGYQGQLFKR